MDKCIVEGVATLKCVPLLFGNVITAGVGFASLVLLFFIALSASKFITAGGDTTKVAAAKKSLTFALIGFVIVVGAFFMIRIVSTVTETPCEVIGLAC